MIKAYTSYKKSGIEWVGDIPANWSKAKLGRAFDLIGSGTTPKSSNRSYYSKGEINWLNTGDLNDSYITKTKKKITQKALEDFSTLKLYPEESVVIALYGATIGKLGQLKIRTSTNQACCVLSNSKIIGNRFLFYFFLHSREHIISLAYGGGQPNISQDIIKQLYIPAPPLKEQTQIAKYLDYQTNIIDQLIDKKEKLVTLLQEQRQAIINEAVTVGLDPNAKMKDSGIEWLGEIPEGWEIIPLKHLATLKGRLGWKGLKAEEYVEKGYGFLSTPDIKHNVIDYNNINFITKERYDESPEIMLKNNDILLVKDGSTLGIVNMIYSLPFPCTVNSSIGVIRIKDVNVLLPEFLKVQLESDYIQSIVVQKKAGQGVPHLFQKDINNFQIVVPSLKAQEQILKSIKSKLSDFNLLFDKLKNQIIRIKEYRQSIISEAVTGKIDLREWKAPKKEIA